MRRWTVVPSAVAPVALIGGWSWAAAHQPPGYDPARDTISALAAHGATAPWIMTTGLAVLGACHVFTAVGLTEARNAGRLLLALGGAATLAVAALRQPAAGHVPAATVAFVALALWPAAGQLPTRRAAVTAAAFLIVLLGGLGVGLATGDLLGLGERSLAGAEALWPLATVLMVGRGARRHQASTLP